MSISVLISAADKRYAGVTSGLSSTTGQVGAAIGIAVFGGLLVDRSRIAHGIQITI